MQPVADRIESEGVCIMLIGDQSMGKELSKQAAPRLAKCPGIVGDVITLVIEDDQRKIKTEEPRVDQFEADHLAARQDGKFAMSLRGRPKAAAGKDLPRQPGV